MLERTVADARPSEVAWGCPRSRRKRLEWQILYFRWRTAPALAGQLNPSVTRASHTPQTGHRRDSGLVRLKPARPDAAQSEQTASPGRRWTWTGTVTAFSHLPAPRPEPQPLLHNRQKVARLLQPHAGVRGSRSVTARGKAGCPALPLTCRALDCARLSASPASCCGSLLRPASCGRVVLAPTRPCGHCPSPASEDPACVTPPPPLPRHLVQPARAPLRS